MDLPGDSLQLSREIPQYTKQTPNPDDTVPQNVSDLHLTIDVGQQPPEML